MDTKITTVSKNLVWTPPGVNALWFFPEGSEYLKYSPHFHTIYEGGFRQNLPLSHMFVVVINGKLTVKDFRGRTTHKVEVRNHVWYARGTNQRVKVPGLYAKAVPR